MPYDPVVDEIRRIDPNADHRDRHPRDKAGDGEFESAGDGEQIAVWRRSTTHVTADRRRDRP
jgi:hypothetical protein